MKRKITGYTRCPQCKERLGFTDYEDGDEIIAWHRFTTHDTPLPTWYKGD